MLFGVYCASGRVLRRGVAELRVVCREEKKNTRRLREQISVCTHEGVTFQTR